MNPGNIRQSSVVIQLGTVVYEENKTEANLEELKD